MTLDNSAEAALLSGDYRDVLRSLSRAEKRRLMTLTNHHGLIRIGAHLSFIAVMGLGNFYLTGLLGWLALIGQGIGLCFLFCAMHEAGHGTAFKSKTLNKAVTYFAGFLLFLGPVWFQSFHAAHHRHTHDSEHDPELATPKPQTWGHYLFHISGIMIWVSSFKTLFANAMTPPTEAFIAPSSRKQIQTEARLILFLYGTIFIGGAFFAPDIFLQFWIVQFWLLPLLLGQPFLRLFLLAEHAGCPHDPDMLKNSRTTRTSPFVLFLSWNMPYHTAHHSFPAIPFHQLPQFHQHIDRYIAVKADSYSAFHRTYAQTMRQS